MTTHRREAKSRSSHGTDARSAARLAAVQALYEVEIAQATVDAVLLEFLGDRWKSLTLEEAQAATGQQKVRPTTPERALFIRLVRGVNSQKPAWDRLIAEALTTEWTLDRLDPVLLAILRCGVFELTEELKVPPKVVINEYLDIANAFYSEEEPKLVNGVLDRLARVVRAGELLSAPGRTDNVR